MKFFITLALAFGLYVPSIDFADAAAMKFRKTCPNPAGTIKRRGAVRTFTLSDRQYGGCPTDKKARHSAPFWERTEIRSVDMKKGQTYDFSGQFNFDPNTKSSERTTFFQIHQYRKGTCPSCYPTVMLKVIPGRGIVASIHNPKGHHDDWNLPVSRNDFAGKWGEWRIRVRTVDGYQPIKIFFNGREVFSGRSYIRKGGAIYPKAGLYRPGTRYGKNPTDRISIKSLQYEVVN